MSLQITWALRGKTFSIRVAIPRGSTFVLQVAHPFVGFLGHISQGSFKGFKYIEPLRIVDDEANKRISNEPIKTRSSELLDAVQEGLLYHVPELCEEGLNGTYFMKNKEGNVVAIFKPRDEEGNSKNNPKRSDEQEDLTSRGLIEGEGALRELAAYKLDKGHFSGVPETELVTLKHAIFNTEDGEMSKTGSLQRFVENDGASWDMGPKRFPVKEVHKIGVLDVRIFNTDRHGGNILLKEDEDGQLELIPIDHGLSLPATLNRAWFDWLMWPQANEPFDERTLQYINDIDVEEDANILREIGIREEGIRTMKISTTLLKKGAAAGLTLFQIGSMISRMDPDVPCELERMYDRAIEECNGYDEGIIQAIYRIMDEEIAKAKAM